MALFESESVAYAGIKTASPAQAPQSPQQREELTQDQSVSSLNKQGSIFSLTLDEIQLKSGKPFGSMNMDEFLANLWNVEENQTPPQNEHCNEGQPRLARQGSFSIPTPLCKKTVDEVWFEIQKDIPQQHAKIEPHDRSRTSSAPTNIRRDHFGGFPRQSRSCSTSIFPAKEGHPCPDQWHNFRCKLRNGTCDGARIPRPPNCPQQHGCTRQWLHDCVPDFRAE